MRKKIFLIFLVLSLFVMYGCTKNTYIKSRPIGYVLLSSDFVGKGSLLYDSQMPFNVNELTLERYATPILWAELSREDALNIEETDENFLVILGDVKRAFIKKMMIDNTIWTAELIGQSVVYKNEQNVDFESYLSSEEVIKSYVEALEGEQTFFLEHTGAILFGIQSHLQKTSAYTPYQKMNEATKVMINYTGQINEFPDLAHFFETYDAAKINLLFLNAYARRDDAEYRFEEYTA